MKCTDIDSSSGTVQSEQTVGIGLFSHSESHEIREIEVYTKNTHIVLNQNYVHMTQVKAE